jgi:hypothetical protein
MLPTGFGSPICQACEEGTYSSGGSREPCTPCGPGMTSPARATSQSFCQCKAGLGDDGNGGCDICGLGSWSSGPVGLAGSPYIAMKLIACQSCSARLTTLKTGATSSADCGKCGGISFFFFVLACFLCCSFNPCLLLAIFLTCRHTHPTHTGGQSIRYSWPAGP